MKECLKVQTNFYQFRDEILQASDSSEKSSPMIFETITFRINSIRIMCNLVNTAWISKKVEEQGKLFFPIKEIINNKSNDEPCDLAITLLHHPYTWFEAENGRNLRNKIDSMSDIILTGHEHESDVYEKVKRNGDTVEYIEGGVLQDASFIESEFNILIIDFDNELQEIYTYTWNKVKNLYEPSNEPLRINKIINPNRPNAGRQLNQEFEISLHDIGMKFTHPTVDEIKIDELFIFPHLRRLLIPSNLQLQNSIIKENIPDFVKANKHILILGTEKCGKTVLSKKIFNIFYETGFYPILIDGSSFKSLEEGRIDSLLKRDWEVQYKRPDSNEYFQLDKCKRVIIIDDFQKSNLNIKGRERVIEYLKGYFEAIIIIGSEELGVDELFLTQEDNDNESLQERSLEYHSWFCYQHPCHDFSSHYFRKSISFFDCSSFN